MRKLLPAIVIALILAVSTSSSAGPELAYDGDWFTVEQFGTIEMPERTPVVISGMTKDYIHNGWVQIWLIQERGKKVTTAWGITCLNDEPANTRWEVEFDNLENRFKPGAIIATCEYWDAPWAVELAEDIDLVLTPR